MNKFLLLAYDVLEETSGMLTSRQIWDVAISRGLADAEGFGRTPWTTLGLLLAKEVSQAKQASVFRVTSGTPRCYFLENREQGWPALVLADKLADFLESVDPKILLQRIRARNPYPAVSVVSTQVYKRDPNLIAYVRLRADHCCELCGEKGFLKEGGGYYIEVHHVKRLADGGEDTPENAAALCAGCHRRLHHSNVKHELLAKLLLNLEKGSRGFKPTQ